MEITNFVRAMDAAAAAGRGSHTQANPKPAVANVSRWDHGWKVVHYDDGSSRVVKDKDGQRFGQGFRPDQKAEAMDYLFRRIELEREREEALRTAGL